MQLLLKHIQKKVELLLKQQDDKIEHLLKEILKLQIESCR